jgi:uncharacterized integral membrane protein
MLTVVLIIILSLLISFLTTLDSSPVSLRFGDATFSGIPLFFIVFFALIIGAFLASVKIIVNIITSKLTIMGKNSDLKKSYETSDQLLGKIERLEEEKLALKEQLKNKEQAKKESKVSTTL